MKFENHANHKDIGIPRESYKNHGNHKKSYENHECHENLKTQCENQANQTNL